MPTDAVAGKRDRFQKSVEEMRSAFDEVCEELAFYQDLVRRQAKRELDALFPSVLSRLSTAPSLPNADEDGWPYATPLGKATFLEHLLWAKNEHHFVHECEAFEKHVRNECRKVADFNQLSGDTCQFLSVACSLDVREPSYDETCAWAADRLFDRAWSELMYSGIGILDEYGIADPKHPHEREGG